MQPASVAAAVAASVFLLVGVLGLIPGMTTGLDGMTFAGHESTAMLLGVFEVSVLHNIVHFLFGVVGVVVAVRPLAAMIYLVGGEPSTCCSGFTG